MVPKKAFLAGFIVPICLAQSNEGETCPPALYIQAGQSDEFPTPNANTTCRTAHLIMVDSGIEEYIEVEQAEVVCMDYPLLHISVPGSIPPGTGKITWLCQDEVIRPCQLIFVEPMSDSASVTASAFSMSQECPSGRIRTESSPTGSSSSLSGMIGSLSTVNADVPTSSSEIDVIGPTATQSQLENAPTTQPATDYQPTTVTTIEPTNTQTSQDPVATADTNTSDDNLMMATSLGNQGTPESEVGGEPEPTRCTCPSVEG